MRGYTRGASWLPIKNEKWKSISDTIYLWLFLFQFPLENGSDLLYICESNFLRNLPFKKKTELLNKGETSQICIFFLPISERPSNDYLTLCEPCGLSANIQLLTQQLQHKSNFGPNISGWGCLCVNKTLFTKTSDSQNFPCKSPNTWNKERKGRLGISYEKKRKSNKSS